MIIVASSFLVYSDYLEKRAIYHVSGADFSLYRPFIFLMSSICYNKREMGELLMTIEEAIEWIHSRLPLVHVLVLTESKLY